MKRIYDDKTRWKIGDEIIVITCDDEIDFGRIIEINDENIKVNWRLYGWNSTENKRSLAVYRMVIQIRERK